MNADDSNPCTIVNISKQSPLDGRGRLRLMAVIDETVGRKAALSRESDERAKQRAAACEALVRRLRSILARRR